MKLLIASDIHGSAYWCERLAEAFREEEADKLILLGDLLYHGPRNPLPDGHNPKKVVEILSKLKNNVVCVRGNCDAEVDQTVLPFPVLADYALFVTEKATLYLTHGHLFDDKNPPPLAGGDVLLNGHTHVPVGKKIGEAHYVNCGSVALPKEDSPHSYLIYENGVFLFKDLESGGIYDSYEI